MQKLNDNTLGRISIWAGTTLTTFEEFSQYFLGLENPGSCCGIHRDFGCRFIDTDLFGTFVTSSLKIVSIQELCLEVPYNNPETGDAIVARCKEIGIHAGNAISYYVNATFIETDPASRYNDMAFVGTFDDP